MTKLNFDVSKYESSYNAEPVPAGRYILKATEEDMVVAKSGNGEFLKVTFEISRGEHAGRKVFMNFNIHNTSEQAQQIGREQLNGWVKACGRAGSKDTAELIDREFEAQLSIEKGSGSYSDQNRISYFVDKNKDKAKGTPANIGEEKEKPAPKKSKASTGGKKNPWEDD